MFNEQLEDIHLLLISGSERRFSGAFIYLLNKYNYKDNIFTTVPVKYLLNVNTTINNLFLDFNFKGNKDSIEILKSFDILLNRAKEIKFN